MLRSEEQGPLAYLNVNSDNRHTAHHEPKSIQLSERSAFQLAASAHLRIAVMYGSSSARRMVNWGGTSRRKVVKAGSVWASLEPRDACDWEGDNDTLIRRLEGGGKSQDAYDAHTLVRSKVKERQTRGAFTCFNSTRRSIITILVISKQWGRKTAIKSDVFLVAHTLEHNSFPQRETW